MLFSLETMRRPLAAERPDGGAFLGPRIYEGAGAAVGGDWGSPNILPLASFHSATPLASVGGKGCIPQTTIYMNKRSENHVCI